MFWGMRYISSGMASVLVWTSSLFLVGLAFVFLRHYERVTLQKLIGVVTGFGGVAAIFGDDLHVGFESPSLMGMLALLCAGLCVALGIVIVKRSGSRYHPSIIACARAVVGGLLLMLTAFTFGQTQFVFSWEAAGAVLFVGLLVYGGADLLFLWLLQRLEAVKLSLVGLLAPVIALFVGFFFFQETVTTLDIIGTGLVTSGLVAVNIG